MTTRERYPLIPSILQKFASIRPVSWLFSVILPNPDRIFLKLTGGRKSLTSILAGLPVAMVTTTGAKSGLPRTLPLVYIRDDRKPGVFALVASNFGKKHNPAWYYNLKANPRAACEIGGAAKEYTAREARGEEYDRFWSCAVDTYFGYALYRERAGKRHIPIMVMEPAGSSA